MKYKWKIMAGMLMSLLFLCSMQTTAVHAAAPSLSASADAAGAQQGEYITVSITLSNNPSLSTLGVALGYDGSVLKYDSTSWSGSFGGSDMKMASDTGSEVNLSVVCEDSYLADGTLASVRFQAVQDTSSIPVTLELRDMADAELSAVNCKVTAKVKTPAKPSTDSSQTEENTPPQTQDKDQNGTDPNNKEDKADKNESSEYGGTVPAQAAGAGQTGSSHENAGNEPAASQPAADSSESRQVTVTAQTNQAQRTAAQNVQQVSASSSTKADESYKTGAGIGNDGFLVLAAVCGITVLLMLIKKEER